uniref:PARP catalytic domain-containing protein n=1 Tax=Chromera velia CCMP2878 TaxID=1169474 RepID=A0A0G4HS60_9ALVE|eukprot:Cvel_1311.t1-p1 / transcript=Cvel_1311.t1 / gene=Cvel_1311 / organism=Chromera_velia_CCMP2878 / gene_product=hypothetical protein / transcript_product=hypothetical protein / location=Cvel_scaffold44:117255-118103(+) / protein_length=283 / sequence_SO=supercontig / SO=protein_coding / is_pseudo=false
MGPLPSCIGPAVSLSGGRPVSPPQKLGDLRGQPLWTQQVRFSNLPRYASVGTRPTADRGPPNLRPPWTLVDFHSLLGRQRCGDFEDVPQGSCGEACGASGSGTLGAVWRCACGWRHRFDDIVVPWLGLHQRGFHSSTESSSGRLGAGVYLTDDKEAAFKITSHRGQPFLVACEVKIGRAKYYANGSGNSWRDERYDSAISWHPEWPGVVSRKFREFCVAADRRRITIVGFEGVARHPHPLTEGTHAIFHRASGGCLGADPPEEDTSACKNDRDCPRVFLVQAG